MRPRPIWFAILSTLVALVGCFMVFTQGGYAATFAQVTRLSFVYALLILIFSVIGNLWTAVLSIPIGLYAAYLAVARLGILGEPGGLGFWLFFLGFLLAAVFSLVRVSFSQTEVSASSFQQSLRRFTPFITIPIVLFLLWQGFAVGFGSAGESAQANKPRGYLIAPLNKGGWGDLHLENSYSSHHRSKSPSVPLAKREEYFQMLSRYVSNLETKPQRLST